MFNALTDVPGIKVGHYSDRIAATGCTVILCEQGAVTGIDVRGSAPATRETDLLDPTCLVERVHAILLTGGSAFGLDAATGVVRYLEEREIGFPTTVAKVPIVPAAALFDLAVGSALIRPDAAAGYRACSAATAAVVAEGSVGAGTGATVGKLRGIAQATKSGVGTASATLGNKIVLGALVAVNAFGDVHDSATNEIIAGPRAATPGAFVDTVAVLKTGAEVSPPIMENTTIGVVATNARLSKAEATKVAQMAQSGVAMVIRPAHSMYDGDAIFALALAEKGETASVTAIGAIAAELVATAIVRAVRQATSLGGIPTAGEWIKGGSSQC